GPLMKQAKFIADSVKKVMQSALDINSPSRVMKNEVGKWIPQGLALGIEENAKYITDAMNKVSDMIMTTTPEIALGAYGINHPDIMLSSGRLANSSVTNNNNRSYSPQINNYFTRDESTPSEVARKNKQQQ